MMRLILIIAGCHMALCVIVFLLFGLGLEGSQTGTWILPILLQPMLFIFGKSSIMGLLFWIIFLVNSLIWGAVLAWGWVFVSDRFY